MPVAEYKLRIHCFAMFAQKMGEARRIMRDLDQAMSEVREPVSMTPADFETLSRKVLSIPQTPAT